MDENIKEYKIGEILSDNKELIERDILTLLVLMKHGKITNPKLLEELNLIGANLKDSSSVVHYKKKLEKLGIVEKYGVKVNWAKLGYPTEFIVIATSNNKNLLLEIERGHIAGIKQYRKKTGASIFVIPLNEDGEKIILRDVFFGGEKPSAIISGLATDDGAARIYANIYLTNKFPGIETALFKIDRSSIRDFEFQDKFIESITPVLFDDDVSIEKYMTAYEKGFKWDLLKSRK